MFVSKLIGKSSMRCLRVKMSASSCQYSQLNEHYNRSEGMFSVVQKICRMKHISGLPKIFLNNLLMSLIM